MISLLGAPFDLCGLRVGSRLGPEALRIAGLAEDLSALGLSVEDLGNVSPGQPEAESPGMRHFAPLMATMRELQTGVRAILDRGRVPIMLGGEHTLSIASVSAALQVHGGSLAVLWIDAHADVNTPGGSLTGNIHGMPLAALAGLPSGTTGKVDEEWREILAFVGGRLPLEHVAWFGLRDVDSAERANLHGAAITMHDVDRHGLVKSVERIDHWLRSTGASRLWISFDVDALDPFLAPGTGTAVRGGLTYREGHLLAELLHEMMAVPGFPCKLAGLDIVETNPIHDRHNETAEVSVEWVASLFGKTII